ncbi:hypothetical protein I4U23_015937 [Adineta vaga]|nr:hypothetical protein I4U23_015937 [Adineta vaga]
MATAAIEVLRKAVDIATIPVDIIAKQMFPKAIPEKQWHEQVEEFLTNSDDGYLMVETSADDMNKIEELLETPKGFFSTPYMIKTKCEYCPHCYRQNNFLDVVATGLRVHKPKFLVDVFTGKTSSDQNYNGLLHDCLYATSARRFDREPYQIIPYCLGEWSSTWKIQTNNTDSKFTFAQLASANITSEQLYLWSAPMDTIQHYQSYLDESPNSATKLLAEEYFYNCTLPDFGPFCEYSLLAYKFDQLFLDEIVNNYYKANKYEPKTLTCYEHLECDRGPLPSCLDWTDICDGKIDCFNDGLDEKYCWKTEINECNEDEFRCLDGQCIPLTFLREEQSHVDCLDISDATVFFSILSSFVNKFLGEPTFGMEDVSCIHIADSRLERISSSCVLKRGELLSETLYSIKPKSITSDQCWTVVKCIIHMPISNEVFCRNLCRKKTCDNIVRDTCPYLVYTTAFPIVLGHIFVLYANNHLKYKETTIPQPTYVCYNDTLLYLPSNNEITMRLDNLTCRFYNTSIIVGDDLERGWIESYIHPLYRWLQLWTSWIYNNSMLCNNTTMYQCMNSSKCISKYRLMDSIQDCFYNDDEDISTLNKNCSTQENLNSFKCETTNECIPRRLFADNICHCTKYDAKNCDDESSRDSKTRMKIYFTTICDGFIHLFPKLIDNRNQTDETDCDLWPCNNVYTRCNDFWNCPNGADELNCDSSPILQCPSNNHICGSLKTNELMCLPIEKANDGIVDCIGGTDEPIRCRMEQPTGVYKSFHCVNDSRRYCISWQTICDGKTQCEHGDDEKICSSINNDEPSELFCYYGSTSMNSPAAEVFCKPFHELSGNHFNFNYFKLAEITDSSQTNLIKNELVIKNIYEEEDEQQQQQRCHRGLESQVWLDKANNLTKLVCFCPPSFYGNFCQYQNQRISITMQFLVSSDTIEIPIIIIISLIDDSDQRMIHSYEQITYLSKKYCQKKFNFYLLYSTRPKNESQQYFIHIDIYERKSLNYRGSTIKKILFPFLPVYRLAFQLAIPSIHDKPEFCSDNQCRNGKCRKYFHDPEFRTFCQCNSGWSGRYCHIPYDCTCSSDSLCLGKLPTNRSICICPLNKLGSRCFLKNTFLCENNQNHICLNGGQCLIIDEYRTKYRQNLCICPKNFTGEKCEIPQARLLISFDTNIILPTGIHIHFIELDPRKHPAHTVSYRMIPYGQRSMTIYWSYKFHLVFIERNENYYLTLVQNQHNQSMSIERTIHLSDRCFHIKELMDEGILNYHLLHRIKYYHVLCQRNNSQNIPCFYDEMHLCLCQNHQSQSVANCFEFEHKKKINCLGKSACINDGTCYQDNLACPSTSISFLSMQFL